MLAAEREVATEGRSRQRQNSCLPATGCRRCRSVWGRGKYERAGAQENFLREPDATGGVVTKLEQSTFFLNEHGAEGG